MKKLVIAMCVGALAACATPPAHYSNPNKTDQDWYQDLTKCRALAGQAMAGREDGNLRNRYVDDCLFGEGWKRDAKTPEPERDCREDPYCDNRYCHKDGDCAQGYYCEHVKGHEQA